MVNVFDAAEGLQKTLQPRHIQIAAAVLVLELKCLPRTGICSIVACSSGTSSAVQKWSDKSQVPSQEMHEAQDEGDEMVKALTGLQMRKEPFPKLLHKDQYPCLSMLIMYLAEG